MSPKFIRQLMHLMKACVWLLLFSWFDLLPSVFKKRTHGVTLLVKLDTIGDFVLSSGVIARLVANDAARCRKTVVVCDKRVEELARFLAGGCYVIGVDIKRFVSWPPYRYAVLHSIACGADVAINLAVSHDLLWADAVIRASRAMRREGMHGPMDRTGSPLLYNMALSGYTKLIRPEPSMQFDAEQIRCGVSLLGNDVAEVTSFTDTRSFPESDKIPRDPYFVACPGSLQKIKEWPLTSFAELSLWLCRTYGLQCVLLGAPNEKPLGDRVEAALPEGTCVNLIGATSLAEALSLLKQSRLVVGNDSALIHLSAICFVPSVVMLGGGHPNRFLPYPKSVTWARGPVVVTKPMSCWGCQWNCIYPIGAGRAAPCITGISLEAVQEACRSALSTAAEVSESV